MIVVVEADFPNHHCRLDSYYNPVAIVSGAVVLDGKGNVSFFEATQQSMNSFGLNGVVTPLLPSCVARTGRDDLPSTSLRIKLCGC